MTANGFKISGRFKILNHETILLKHKKINIREIIKIKRNPIILTIITNGILYYYGALLLGTSIVWYTYTINIASLLLTIPSAGFIYGVINLSNILKEYKTSTD